MIHIRSSLDYRLVPHVGDGVVLEGFLVLDDGVGGFVDGGIEELRDSEGFGIGGVDKPCSKKKGKQEDPTVEERG